MIACCVPWCSLLLTENFWTVEEEIIFFRIEFIPRWCFIATNFPSLWRLNPVRGYPFSYHFNFPHWMLLSVIVSQYHFCRNVWTVFIFNIPQNFLSWMQQQYISFCVISNVLNKTPLSLNLWTSMYDVVKVVISTLHIVRLITKPKSLHAGDFTALHQCISTLGLLDLRIFKDKALVLWYLDRLSPCLLFEEATSTISNLYYTFSYTKNIAVCCGAVSAKFEKIKRFLPNLNWFLLFI